MSHSPRKINTLVVANRSEIAQRIIQSARELPSPPRTIALYSHTNVSKVQEDDSAHTAHATVSVQLPSATAFTDQTAIIDVALAHNADAIHPGYGFLSESAAFALAAASAGIHVVGPGAAVLAMTGDKLAARELAMQCRVPVLPGLKVDISGLKELGDSNVKEFIGRERYPVLIKAVGGGGGRGITAAWDDAQLDSVLQRAKGRRVYVEKMAGEGYLHVEVQVVGDGKGGVVHLFERQCSIQRRWQKVVEVAPCVGVDREFLKEMIDASVKMAKAINYSSLGTFEFLANPQTRNWYFLEINPRLQVEHTVTEAITDVDIVRAQLLLAQGASLADSGLPSTPPDPLTPPSKFSIQLRVTAEDASRDWALSAGRIGAVSLPCGNGVRVDTCLVQGQVVSPDFDSLLAKIVVSALTWDATVSKARRALEDTHIAGVTTNLNVLRGIVAHPDFVAAGSACDTGWLERKLPEVLELDRKIANSMKIPAALPLQPILPTIAASSGAPVLRKGDAWTINLVPKDSSSKDVSQLHLALALLKRNDFPSELSGTIALTAPSSGTTHFDMVMSSTSASAEAVTSRHRRGSQQNPRHVVIPFPGKLLEVLVDVGDAVKEDDVICVVQQMKMEIEIRARRAGRVVWVTEAEDGEDVDEGILAAEIELDGVREDSKL